LRHDALGADALLAGDVQAGEDQLVHLLDADFGQFLGSGVDPIGQAF
jgi:hypothetical protein